MTAPTSAPGARLRGAPGGRALVLVVTAVVGFLLVGQLRGTERFRQRLSAESEGDLTRILASLTTEADSLRTEISDLRLQLQALETSSQRDSSAAQSIEDQLRNLQVLAGTVPVSGPGVVLTIEDPDGAVTFDVLLDIVQELRDAGAEALGINGRRFGATSALTEQSGRPALDGVVLKAPFLVQAIGQATTLEGGLKIPGGAIDTLSSLRGVSVDVERTAQLDIPALSRPPTLTVARPVGSGS
jgi:uncharacterized protein YlxW (UPF0749 family)